MGIVLYDDSKTSQLVPRGSLKIEMLFIADCLTFPMSKSVWSKISAFDEVFNVCVQVYKIETYIFCICNCKI